MSHVPAKEGCVAFIDLLGFKTYLKDDKNAALELLTIQSNMLQLPNLRSGVVNRGDPIFSSGGRNTYGFDFFHPFSDSIIIAGEKPNEFISNLSRFLVDAYLFISSSLMFPRDAEHPEVVDIPSVSVGGDMEISRSVDQRKWHPPLYRGGVSFGNYQTYPSPTIINGEFGNDTQIIFGQGLVDAYAISEEGKGPRIFCDRSIKDKLSDQPLSMVRKIDEADCYEIMWPMVAFEGDDPYPVIEMIVPCIHFYMAHLNKPPIVHYYNMLRLLIRAGRAYFSPLGREGEILGIIKGCVAEHGTPELLRDLNL